jgi:hypothetical protein
MMSIEVLRYNHTVTVFIIVISQIPGGAIHANVNLNLIRPIGTHIETKTS